MHICACTHLSYHTCLIHVLQTPVDLNRRPSNFDGRSRTVQDRKHPGHTQVAPHISIPVPIFPSEASPSQPSSSSSSSFVPMIPSLLTVPSFNSFPVGPRIMSPSQAPPRPVLITHPVRVPLIRSPRASLGNAIGTPIGEREIPIPVEDER